MAWTTDDLAALKSARATGARRVRYADGTEMEYRDDDEMRSLQAEMERELNPTAKPFRAFRGSIRQGY